MKRRYLCMACRCDELEIAAGVDGDLADSIFVCFHCQQLFHFMADAAPRPLELSLFALYDQRGRSG
jgi:hypothetical protein